MAKTEKKAFNASYYDVIQSPVITEKSTIAGSYGKYVFKVAVDANKTSVKNAVEALFGVTVEKVNIMNYDGKLKIFRQNIGRRNHTKKAIVTLKQGQSIDLASGAKA